ncbi:glycosyl hydrolases family 31-domain-containing protein [Mycena pura]|uniref:Glycosyl hydrolases family 31-domain-containing protein n=1 Tax=Mycena pura TaxID=153505 RepID=A0AAD6UNV4_9AGAR|nr:glycosyl hydrolases family 31-domain-containing protein [Mycena pura]
MLHLSLSSLALLLAAGSAFSTGTGGQEARRQAAPSVTHSFNVSTCPGYTLSDLSETRNGLTAKLNLAGPACNAFGADIASLTIQVSYETQSRLHVTIFDTANSQFTVPESIIATPGASGSSTAGNSDLVFNHENSPFAFWITRRSEPDATPLFDTRKSSLPATPIAPVIQGDKSTALDGFPLVFEDQYLQLTSALPLDANVYGLGEVVATSGLRRDVGTNGGVGTIQTDWARDSADPTDQNIYGSHPVYIEHRLNSTTNTSQTHGVFLLSPAAADILLLTPPSSLTSLIQYRLIGGIISLYFLSGPTPVSVIEQYSSIVGTPTWQPYWGFGFHLCRFGYTSINDTKGVVQRMRDANIPLETQWTDIDLFHAFRDFTTDPVTFPLDEVVALITQLHQNSQHYISIVDAAIGTQTNSTDFYDPYLKGKELNVFIKNPDGTDYVGQVWPGFTVFPDWFAPNTLAWWTEALKNWSLTGVEFSGIWLDMNEISSFCEGSCGSEIAAGNAKTDGSGLSARGIGAGNQTGIDINNPPYAIHNGNGRLAVSTLSPNATHFGGYAELDVHNMWGLTEEMATHLALKSVLPGQRPFIISRSTFPSAGKWTGHWLGDNFSRWEYMYWSIQGILQFQIFQIPFVGADTCGFNEDTTEELCNRWMQLSAFAPFYRNHNTKGAASQEPFIWESVTNASIVAIAVRYSLLPYWYTLFANASTNGTPPVRALFWEFPDEAELFAVDRQFLVGRDILVTPVLTSNVSTVDGIFPGRGKTIWRDWYTHDVINATVGANTTLSAPLGHINVHIRDGAALLLHASPAYTVEETRQGPFALLVAQSRDGSAFGTAYIDDGLSDPPGPSTTVTFQARKNGVTIATSHKAFEVVQKLVQVTILGVETKPTSVSVGGTAVREVTYNTAQQELILTGLTIDLNEGTTISW